uniref:Nudix hydrolase domain-containing protein n=1 Tax=viral metagenome TaxID=1070528 RepID=A0A6C0DBE1_9ZZZZ
MPKKNGAVIFITDTNRILLVRDKRNHQWMVPGGGLNPGERSRDGAFREFFEETTFTIDPRKIISESRYNYINSFGDSTAIFIIRSNQRFGTFRRTNETDAIYYIKINDFKNLVNLGIPHHTVKVLRPVVIKSSKELLHLL